MSEEKPESPGGGAAHGVTPTRAAARADLLPIDDLPTPCALHELVSRDPPSFRFVAVNEAFERLSGLGRAEVVGRTLSDLLPWIDGARQAELLRILDSGRPAAFERYVPALGKHLRTRVFQSGELLAVTLSDDSERAALLSELRDREAHLSAIFRAAPAGIGVTFNRVLREVNERFCTMIGYEREELIGQPARILYPSDEEFLRVGRVKYAAIAKTGLGRIECVMRRKDGSEIDVLLSSTPLVADDLSQGVTFTAMDITEEKRAQREREQLQRQLLQAQKLEAIGTLAAGIAHDFNNVLTAMLGYADLARETAAGSPEVVQDLDEVLRGGDRAKELVAQILAFARHEEGTFEHLRLQDVIQEASRLLRRSIPSDVSFVQEIDEGCGPIFANGTRIHQVVVNLVTNAYHAVRQDDAEHRRPWITLSLQEVGERPASSLEPAADARRPHALLRVADNGCGMPPEVQERIFDPYFTTKGPQEGSGLGLSIVHGIVRSAGGTIRVASQPGQGTEISVYLPIAPPKDEDMAGQASASDRPHGSERILVVDDEQAVLAMTCATLRRFGYEVAAAPDAAAALELFESSPEAFDLVVTDQAMPGMTGTQLSRALKVRHPDLPVVLCTGYARDVTPEQAHDLGVTRMARKPLYGEDLAQLVRRVLDEPPRGDRSRA